MICIMLYANSSVVAINGKHKTELLTSKVVVEPEVGRRIRPTTQTEDVTEGGAGSQRSGSGDAPGGSWSSLYAGLDEAVGDAATEGSCVQRLMRKRRREEESTVLQTQAVTLLQDEFDSLHRADAQVVLPRFDVEGRCKMTWTVSLGESGRDEAKVSAFPTKMCIVAQEGYKL